LESAGNEPPNNTCVHILAQSIGGVTITRAYTGGDMLVLNASPNGYCEIGGINFTGSFSGTDDNYTFTVTVHQLTGLPVSYSRLLVCDRV
jgi:hypothetical protein